MCCSGECIQDGRGGNVCAASSNTTTTDTTDPVEVVVVEGDGDKKDDGKQHGKEAKKEERPKNDDSKQAVAKEGKDVKGEKVVEDKTEREFWNRWVTDDELNNMN